MDSRKRQFYSKFQQLARHHHDIVHLDEPLPPVELLKPDQKPSGRDEKNRKRMNKVRNLWAFSKQQLQTESLSAVQVLLSELRGRNMNDPEVVRQELMDRASIATRRKQADHDVDMTSTIEAVSLAFHCLWRMRILIHY